MSWLWVFLVFFICTASWAIGLAKPAWNNRVLAGAWCFTMLTLLVAILHGPGEPLGTKLLAELGKTGESKNVREITDIVEYGRVLTDEERKDHRLRPHRTIELRPTVSDHPRKSWGVWIAFGIALLNAVFYAPFAAFDEITAFLNRVGKHIEKRRAEKEEQAGSKSAAEETPASRHEETPTSLGFFGRLLRWIPVELGAELIENTAKRVFRAIIGRRR